MFYESNIQQIWVTAVGALRALHARIDSGSAARILFVLVIRGWALTSKPSFDATSRGKLYN